MSVRLLWGRNWYLVPNGNLRIRWGGNWQVANRCYVKLGGVGAGYWADSGYLGYPNPPQSIWVHSWDFSNIAIGFSGPAAGGAPVAYYQIQMQNADGGYYTQVDVGGSPWGNFGVGEDWRNQFYVRSVSVGGLVSAWTGPIRTQIGHSEQGYQATENRARGWEQHTSGPRNANEFLAVAVPSSVSLNAIHWNNLYTPMSSVVAPGTNRDVNWVFFNNDYGTIRAQLGTIVNGNSSDWSVAGNQGDGSYWGIVPRGAGWSTTGNGTYMMWCDDLWVDGTETYQVWVYYVTRNYAGNTYW